MLVKFKSKAAAEVMMYEEHAKRILDLLHKDPKQGVITAAETDNAIKLLENEIVESKAHVASEAVERDIVAHHNENGDDNEHEDPQPVSFSSRAYPLLEMLRAAREQKADILWGVLP
ncbi:MAG TPA: DUF1840 domain-containing protein [Oxalicibacterium sp.]|nr:DUF1840 domain-containing protein [Oxalicibacterium sp.]